MISNERLEPVYMNQELKSFLDLEENQTLLDGAQKKIFKPYLLQGAPTTYLDNCADLNLQDIIEDKQPKGYFIAQDTSKNQEF